jgi:exodeoxyribonuclease-5
VTTLSPEQDKALDQILDWYERQPRNWIHCNGATDCPSFPHTHGTGALAPVFAVGGWAGSGKTTLMRVLDETIGGEVMFGTPTHKAAGVLRKKLSSAQAERVRTYHSVVYQMTPTYRCSATNRLVMKVNTKCTCGKEDACECPVSFLPCGSGGTHECKVTQELRAERRQHLGGHRDVIVIDESSMLSKQHVEDVRRFGVPVILVGDSGQLPPIKEPMNPWIMNPDVELKEIHRQGADSGILLAAHDVRIKGFMSQSSYGKGDTVRMVRPDPRVGELLNRFTPGEDGALITYTNKMRAMFNRVYHDSRTGGGPVAEGDRVVSLGGQPYEADLVEMDGGTPRLKAQMTRVHNGMTGTVVKVSVRSVMAELYIQLDDHPLATKDEPVIIYTGAVPVAQFGAEKELPFNSPDRPKGSRLWDYAYALTAHKAQGSEFPKVIVVDQGPREYRQWMYTALTRAQEAAVVIDWTK